MNAWTCIDIKACRCLDGSEEVSSEFLDDFGEFEEVAEEWILVGFHWFDLIENNVSCVKRLGGNLFLDQIIGIFDLLEIGRSGGIDKHIELGLEDAFEELHNSIDQDIRTVELLADLY